MSAVAKLDRLIDAGRRAGRQESARLIDSLLAMSIEDRWRLLMTRDRQLTRLAPADYQLFVRSLGINAVLEDAPATWLNDMGPITGATPVVEPRGVAAGTGAARFRCEPTRTADAPIQLDGPLVWALPFAVCVLLALAVIGVGLPWSSDGPAVTAAVADQAEERHADHLEDRLADEALTRQRWPDRVDDATHVRETLRQLKADLADGRPFLQSLAQAERHLLVLPIADGGALQRLLPLAEAGVPTLDGLRQALGSLHDRHRERTQSATLLGAMGRLARRMAGGLAPAQRRADRVNQALLDSRRELDRGHLNAAIRMVTGVAAGVGPEAVEWLELAHARRAATMIAEQLETMIDMTPSLGEILAALPTGGPNGLGIPSVDVGPDGTLDRVDDRMLA